MPIEIIVCPICLLVASTIARVITSSLCKGLGGCLGYYKVIELFRIVIRIVVSIAVERTTAC